VSIDGQNSKIFDRLLRKVQGSILGPIRYANFVSPLFDLYDLSAFADDTFIPICNKNHHQLAQLLKDNNSTSNFSY
jgi:hypothetical protein